MNDTSSAGPAACCARFYEQSWVQQLLGESFHPGGLDLSARLLESLKLPADAAVLDVACGIGSTTLLMARRYGWEAMGIDASERNVVRARERAAEPPVVLTSFLQGSRERVAGRHSIVMIVFPTWQQGSQASADPADRRFSGSFSPPVVNDQGPLVQRGDRYPLIRS